MAAIDDLIDQISDVSLRKRIRNEVNRIQRNKKFGLVFENHLPECTPLYGLKIRVGSKVALKNKKPSDMYIVQRITGDKASCEHLASHKNKILNLSDLVCVAEFGDPIYPYLQKIDEISTAPESDLWHELIEADNYHALQLLDYLYTGKVDCIYIDPPYNTGARDWKYNNDYVDSSDSYRHSKWLSFMEKRLRLAKKLLKKETGTLIVAIDDYEINHLRDLLEEIFPSFEINTVIINHHPQGGSANNVSRTHEYALFVTPKGKQLLFGKKSIVKDEKWSLMRGGTDRRNLRIGRPNSFYAIFVNKKNGKVVGVGPHLDVNDTYELDTAPNNCKAFYPIGRDGTERVWRYERSSMLNKIKAGRIVCTKNETLQVVKHRDNAKHSPITSVWTGSQYNASQYGTSLLYDIFSKENRFAYPKSLYTVRDCINAVVQNRPNAKILDFFAGSATTLHAVNLLNAQDGGNRQCILVTNNEFSNSEEKKLKEKGVNPEDREWERWGIAHYIAWPRIKQTILGKDIKGNALKGDYNPKIPAYISVGKQSIKVDEKNLKRTAYVKKNIPIYPNVREIKKSDGFKSNVIYFKLGFLDKNSVALGKQFRELLPILWMKADGIGKCPTLKNEDTLPDYMILSQNKFAILLDEKYYREFLNKVYDNDEIKTVFIITNSDDAYHEMIANLEDKQTYQLYKDYLDNFRINTRG